MWVGVLGCRGEKIQTFSATKKKLFSSSSTSTRAPASLMFLNKERIFICIWIWFWYQELVLCDWVKFGNLVKKWKDGTNMGGAKIQRRQHKSWWVEKYFFGHLVTWKLKQRFWWKESRIKGSRCMSQAQLHHPVHAFSFAIACNRLCTAMMSSTTNFWYTCQNCPMAHTCCTPGAIQWGCIYFE